MHLSVTPVEEQMHGSFTITERASYTNRHKTVALIRLLICQLSYGESAGISHSKEKHVINMKNTIRFNKDLEQRVQLRTREFSCYNYLSASVSSTAVAVLKLTVSRTATTYGRFFVRCVMC